MYFLSLRGNLSTFFFTLKTQSLYGQPFDVQQIIAQKEMRMKVKVQICSFTVDTKFHVACPSLHVHDPDSYFSTGALDIEAEHPFDFFDQLRSLLKAERVVSVTKFFIFYFLQASVNKLDQTGQDRL